MMDENELKEFQIKLAIAYTAAELYVEHDGSFSMHQLAKEMDFSVGEIFEFFDDQQEIIYFFYSSLVKRYRVMIEEIDGFDEFSISEKLSNFAYASFDMMAEHEPFVDQTFKHYILHSCKRTTYEEQIGNLLKEFIENDPGKSASSSMMINECSLRLIQKKYLHLIRFWLNDESENKQVTTELTDKVTGLIEEVLYTSFLDRSLDLAKFLFSNDTFSGHVPLWDKITSSFEIK